MMEQEEVPIALPMDKEENRTSSSTQDQLECQPLEIDLEPNNGPTLLVPRWSSNLDIEGPVS